MDRSSGGSNADHSRRFNVDLPQIGEKREIKESPRTCLQNGSNSIL
ncbi:MAG: hypothetical protein ACTSU2_09365 [Promethearchaeota archaeon]